MTRKQTILPKEPSSLHAGAVPHSISVVPTSRRKVYKSSMCQAKSVVSQPSITDLMSG